MGPSNSGMGGFVSGGSIRFSRNRGGAGVDAWRDQLMQSATSSRASSSRARTSGTKLPKVNTIHQATVVALQTFGCFVQLGDGDAYKDGLLHVSAICADRLETPEDGGIALDMRLWVKVADVNDAEGKYGVDIRYVNQKDGKDLDPYNTKGRLPNNFFQGKSKIITSAAAAIKPSFGNDFAWKENAGAPEQVLAMPALTAASGEKKRKKKDLSSDSEEIASDEVAEARVKASKKLEKARKKLEKMKKKAEKKQKKQDKKKDKKDKPKEKKAKAQAASDEESDPCPSASSDS